MWTNWSRDALLIDFDSQSRNVGRGEARIAIEFDGSLVSHNSAFDVLTRDGKKIEVKELSDHKFRCGSRSVHTVYVALSNFFVAIKLLEKFSMSLTQKSIDVLGQETYDMLTSSLIDDIKNIFLGEISQSRVDRIKQIFLVLREILRVDMCDRAFVILATEKRSIVKKIDTELYARMGISLNATAEQLGISEIVRLATIVQSDALKDPEEFFSKHWSHAVKASDVFRDIDMIAIVERDRYAIIQNESFDDYFKFCSVSQGKARFRAVNLGV